MSKFKEKLYKNVMLVVHKWENGILNSVEHFFNKVEDAVAYGTGKNPDDEHQHIKVYDHHGQCVHDSHEHGHHDHYA